MKAYMLGAQLLALPVDTEVVIDGGVGVDELPVRWTGPNEDGSRFLICVVVPEVPSPVHWCAGTRHGWPVLACGEDSRVGAGLHTHDRASVNCPDCCVKLDATGWTPTPPTAPKPGSSKAWLKTSDMDAIEDLEACVELRRSGFNRLNIGGAIELTVWIPYKAEPVRYTSTAKGEWTQTHPATVPAASSDDWNAALREAAHWSGDPLDLLRDEVPDAPPAAPEATWRTTQPPRVECRWRNEFGAEGTATPRRGGGWSLKWDNDFDPETFVALPNGWQWSPMPKPEAPVTAPDEVPTLTIGDGPTVPFSLPHSPPARSSVSVTLDAPARAPIAFVHVDEHERVKAAAKKALRSRDHLNTVQLRWERWARDLSGLSKASPGAVRARLSSLIDSLAEYRELAIDIADVRDRATPDAELRAALLAETEQMAREALVAGRLERELAKVKADRDRRYMRCMDWRDRIAVLCGVKTLGYSDDQYADRALYNRLVEHVEQRGRDLSEVERRERERVERELLDYQVWARGLVGMNLPDDSGADIRGMLSARLRGGVAMGEALGRVEEGSRSADRGRAGGIEARLSLQARPSDVYKPDDAYMEAFRAGWDAIDGQLRHVHDGAIAEGRSLEREKAAHREETHDEDVRAALGRARADFDAEASEAREAGMEWRLKGRTDDCHYIAEHVRSAFDAGYTDTDERLRNGSLPRTACLWSDLATWTGPVGLAIAGSEERWSIWRLCASWPDVERRCRARADFGDRNLSVDP